MPTNLALQIISHYLSNSDNSYDECVFEFFGGEPFLAFPLIKEICEFTWSKNWKKPYLFTTTTNGTLVHGEIQDWLIKNRNKFDLILSLDGTKEMHDSNRSNSFSKIDIEFFRSYCKQPSVKMTISKETLQGLSEGVMFLHSKGFKINNNLAFGLDWSNRKEIEIFNIELEKLVEFYILNQQITPCSLLNMKIQYCFSPVRKWCGVGTNMITFDIDGSSYPCNMFLPMSIGMNISRLNPQLDFNDLEKLVDTKCTDCFIHPICPTCYGSNYLMRHDISSRDENLCKFMKLRSLANSYLQLKKIMNENKCKSFSTDEYLIVKSALEIQKKIKV